MRQNPQFETASFCSPFKQAMRLDALTYEDRTGNSRAHLADQLGVSVSTLNQWLSPRGAQMPEAYEQRWVLATCSMRIFRVGEPLDEYEMLVTDILETMALGDERRRAA